MNKELTPLEALENIKGSLDSYCIQYWNDKELKQCMMNAHTEQYKLIKKALNDYENLKLKHRSMQDAVLEDFKKLKALNFIKEEIEFGFEIVNNQTRLTLTARGVKVMSITINKEKYDLLKEVLL